eukprot:950900-Pleurochrysis_carterae.AAC.5
MIIDVDGPAPCHCACHVYAVMPYTHAERQHLVLRSAILRSYRAVERVTTVKIQLNDYAQDTRHGACHYALVLAVSRCMLSAM